VKPNVTFVESKNGEFNAFKSGVNMIQIVNIKTYRSGDYVYIGRNMPGRPGSPLGNPYRLRFECDREKILARYEYWLREQLKTDTPARREIERLADYAENLVLACWCAPKLCHGLVVKKIIEERLKERHWVGSGEI